MPKFQIIVLAFLAFAAQVRSQDNSTYTPEIMLSVDTSSDSDTPSNTTAVGSIISLQWIDYPNLDAKLSQNPVNVILVTGSETNVAEDTQFVAFLAVNQPLNGSFDWTVTLDPFANQPSSGEAMPEISIPLSVLKPLQPNIPYGFAVSDGNQTIVNGEPPYFFSDTNNTNTTNPSASGTASVPPTILTPITPSLTSIASSTTRSSGTLTRSSGTSTTSSGASTTSTTSPSSTAVKASSGAPTRVLPMYLQFATGFGAVLTAMMLM